MTRRARAAATTAALFALVLLVGTAVYLAAEEDDPPPVVTTTTTTTTLGVDEVAAMIAGPLRGDLRIAVTEDEARCVARELLQVFPTEDLEDLRSLGEPIAALDEPQRSRLLRGVVRCLPPASAEALLSSGSTTTIVVGLPDEG